MTYRVPKRDSLRDTICRVIFREGPMTPEGIAGFIKAIRSNQVKSAVAQLKHYGCLEEDKGVYRLAEHVFAHYSGVVLVKVDTVKPVGQTFKPLSLANMGWLRHKDRLRDISFMNLTSEFRQLGEPA